MLLWKTSQPPSDGAEIVRRPQPKVRRVPREIRQASRASEHNVAGSAKNHVYRTGRDEEERYIVKMMLMMLLILVLPAVLMLLYIFFTPDAFQYDITTQQDF